MIKNKNLINYLMGKDLISLRRLYLDSVKDDFWTRLDFASSFVLRYGSLGMEAYAAANLINGRYKEGIASLAIAELSRLFEHLDTRKIKRLIHKSRKFF